MKDVIKKDDELLQYYVILYTRKLYLLYIKCNNMLYIMLKYISPKRVTESSFVNEMLSQGLWLGGWTEQLSHRKLVSNFPTPFFHSILDVCQIIKYIWIHVGYE